jgi:stage III sporulation protein AG
LNSDWLKKLMRNKDTLKYAVLGVLAGVMLIFAGNFFPSGEKQKPEIKTASNISSDSLSDSGLEQRMEDFFGGIEGVGKVKVMITYKSSGEKIVADETNERDSQNNDGDKVSKETSKEVKKVIVNGSNGNQALVVKELSPEIEGIVIITQGGGDVLVKDALLRAAQALTDVPSYKIEILKMGG